MEAPVSSSPSLRQRPSLAHPCCSPLFCGSVSGFSTRAAPALAAPASARQQQQVLCPLVSPPRIAGSEAENWRAGNQGQEQLRIPGPQSPPEVQVWGGSQARSRGRTRPCTGRGGGHLCPHLHKHEAPPPPGQTAVKELPFMRCFDFHCSTDSNLLQLSCLGYVCPDVFLKMPSIIQNSQAVSGSALSLGM